MHKVVAIRRLNRRLEHKMPDNLQVLVDRLGHMLHRSVAVDDPDLRIIVYSNHYGDEDPARMQALVGRGAVGHMLEYLAGHRINTWREPRYMDADESLGLNRRLVIPLWAGQTLLGFTWIIVRGDLEPGELEASLEASREITGILSRRAGQQADDELRRSALVGELLADGQATRENAALALSEDRTYAAAREFTVLLIHRVVTAPRGSPDLGALMRAAVGKALATGPGDGWGLAPVEGGIAVLLGTRFPLGPAAADDLGRQIHRELHVRGKPSHAGVVVGVGATVADLREAVSSLGQANAAARAAVAGGFGSASWEGLGLAALLPALVDRPVEMHLVPEVFHSLMAKQGAETLRLIETYLETAADTAQLLHLHRSSVYYKLGQFQKSTGCDLGDGNARFYLHLWFKARKLAFPENNKGKTLPIRAKK